MNFRSKFSVLFLLATIFVSSAVAQNLPEAKCKEFRNSIFRPCICANDVPTTIQYRPALASCGGNAAAILGGSFATAFSVVLRDNQNRDRWPASNYNNCSAAETALGLNKCSAFKCQSILKGPAGEQICCFGEPGFSKILRRASRMTIKFRDVPNAGNDPLARICLRKFSSRLNLN